jgi:hypothetical protein
MNKHKLAENLHCRVRLWPIPLRVRTDGIWLPPIDYDWIIRRANEPGIVELSNIGTDHVALLGSDRIHHFDHEPHRDWDGLKHGLLELRVQLVLQGRDVHYLPLRTFRPRQRSH